ncbi:unnamed protein product [Mytilus edulis]|uniref:Uncharacterized protein n=1 Tax=Mytilus edulis TaxID=6550 RepID=A0A8S3RLH1_MYTED|nr:unnamed protein product [Mytilus edulis]
MPMTKAEKQKAYRDRKKQQEGESYLEKERQRTKAYYVPIAERSKTDQEKRRKKVRKLVQKHRERNRQSTIEPSTSQPSQQVESTSQEQERAADFCFETPSLALNMGHNLVKTAEIKRGNAIRMLDDVLKKKVMTFDASFLGLDSNDICSCSCNTEIKQACHK